MKVLGTVIIGKLSKVQPNPWNPNEMEPVEFESLVYGLQHDGWLLSQSLLVWGKDDKGKVRNLIIDGEHRYRAAVQLDFAEGPMVFLHGLSEAKAKALTISINRKRGNQDPESLVDVIRSIERDLASDDMALDLGFNSEELFRLLSAAPSTAQPPSPPASKDNEGSSSRPPIVSRNPHTKVVPLYLEESAHAAFTSNLDKLTTRFKTKNVSETVLEALRRAKK